MHLKILLAFFVLFSLSSCNQTKEKKQKDPTFTTEKTDLESTEDNANFSLTLKAKFEKDDFLDVFYLQEQGERFNVDQVFSKQIIPDSKYQEITVIMPEDVYPINLRIDLGRNKEQSLVKIQECQFAYRGHIITIKGSELNHYFNFNEGVEIQSDSLTFNLKSFEEGNKTKYDPFIEGNQNLIKLLMNQL